MGTFKLVVAGKFDFENVDLVFDNFFGIFGSVIGSKKYMLERVIAMLIARVSQKTKKSFHHFLNESSELRGLEMNLSFQNVFKINRFKIDRY